MFLSAVSMAAAQGDLHYKAYERICYVNNPIDTNTQCMSIFAPANAKDDSPILLKTYTTDFRSATPQQPSADDETILALQNGIVVCVVGCRGHNSLAINTRESTEPVKKKKKKKKATVETDVEYCGKLPAPLIDLKAAVRYLRANDATLPGSSEKIIATGYMAGGGLAALLGATANNPIYADALKQLGAADVSDQIYGVACFAPLANPMDAAQSGEWLMDGKGNFPNFIRSLALLIPETEAPLNANTYRNYLKDIIFNSAREAMDGGAQISEDMGTVYYKDSKNFDDDEYLIDINLNTYINYIRTLAYKNGYKNYYNTLAIKAYGNQSAADYAQRVLQMNISEKITPQNLSMSKKWFIRHGTLDATVPITESITLMAMVSNLGIDVNFAAPWGVANSRDYNMAELVEWIKGL